jgi:hypothetical protein
VLSEICRTGVLSESTIALAELTITEDLKGYVSRYGFEFLSASKSDIFLQKRNLKRNKKI